MTRPARGRCGECGESAACCGSAQRRLRAVRADEPTQRLVKRHCVIERPRQIATRRQRHMASHNYSLDKRGSVGSAVFSHIDKGCCQRNLGGHAWIMNWLHCKGDGLMGKW